MAASGDPTAAAHEFLRSLVSDPALPADTRLAIGRRIFRDDRYGSLAERSKQPPRDRKRAGEGRETSLRRTATSVANVGLATLPTFDLLLRMVQDAAATPTERLKAASEAARFLLPKEPGPKKSRRGKFPPDEYGFSVDPNLARELRDAKLQLDCLRLANRHTPHLHVTGRANHSILRHQCRETLHASFGALCLNSDRRDEAQAALCCGDWRNWPFD